MTFDTWKDRRNNAQSFFIGQTAGILIVADTCDKATILRYLREATDKLNADFAAIDAEFNKGLVPANVA